MASVLVVDADTESASHLTSILVEGGLRSHPVPDLSDATRALNDESFDAVVLDLGPQTRGPALADVLSHFDDLPVILATGDGSNDVLDAIRAGAADVIEKPFNAAQVLYVVKKVLSVHGDEETPSTTRRSARPIGASRAMQQVFDVVRRVAAGSATVLLRGESGTGKELIARAIHSESGRKNAPFVKVHCGSLPDSLLESELFGYEKGAFTGATARKPGRVEIADGGTLFFDEIGDITPSMQIKLLRLLQDREYERLGGTSTLSADVRFIAATHRDLDRMIRSGEFREDLFYRLNVVPIWLPPLRARRDDIEPLALHYAALYADAHGKPGTRLSETAISTLRSERWPGNVRQLQNFIERLVVLSEGSVIDEDIVRRELAPPEVYATQNPDAPSTVSRTTTSRPPSSVIPLDAALRDAERHAIERALHHAKGNRTLAARLLGVSRATLYTKLEEHGLRRRDT